MQTQQEQALERLREEIELVVGRKMKTPKDFDFLAEQIFEKIHETVSPTTLKRIWGYLSEPSTPRLFTLDLLAQFVGYKDWDAFCHQDSSPVTPASTPHKHSSLNWSTISSIAVTIVILLLSGIIIRSSLKSSEAKKGSDQLVSDYLLKRGAHFDKPQDYLELFGIHDLDFFWGREIPNYPGLYIWGPEYGNPTWGNKGDSAAMMPTISVHWSLENVSQEQIARRNSDFYYQALHRNEIRLTFMKDLVYPGYVFLGAYRLSKEESDSTHNVWERVQDDLYLHDLNQLYKYRN